MDRGQLAQHNAQDEPPWFFMRNYLHKTDCKGLAFRVAQNLISTAVMKTTYVSQLFASWFVPLVLLSPLGCETTPAPTPAEPAVAPTSQNKTNRKSDFGGWRY
jgi:hypothetical protein